MDEKRTEHGIIVWLRIAYMVILVLLIVGYMLPRYEHPEYFVYVENNEHWSSELPPWNPTLPPIRDCSKEMTYDMFGGQSEDIVVNNCVTTNLPHNESSIYISSSNPTYYAVYYTYGIFIVIGMIFAFVFLFGERLYKKLKRMVQK